MKKEASTCQISSFSIEHLNDKPEGEQDFAMYRLEQVSQRFFNFQRPHRHDYYTLLFNEQGFAKHEIDFDNYTILDRQAYFISPEQI
ncbi:MAG: hypothetical protein AAFU64_20545, partial [Bacteroidota bacterium]